MKSRIIKYLTNEEREFLKEKVGFEKKYKEEIDIDVKLVKEVE